MLFRSPPKKQKGLADYEFSIAIENSFEDSYVTEKLFDCYLYNTVPLYCGTETADNFYDKSSFINIDVRSEQIIDHIFEVYYNYNNLGYSSNVLRQKEKYFTEYNIFNKTCGDLADLLRLTQHQSL